MTKTEFRMPRMGESITEAAIITWFKNVGDTVEIDEPLLEVATDKVDSEIASPVTGVVEELLFKANDIIKIGDVIAIISTTSEGKKIAKNNKGLTKIETPKKDRKPEQVTPSKIAITANQNSNLFFSPLIVSIAKEHHISFDELARIPATGREGRLRKSDVMDYLAAGRPHKFATPVVASSGFKIPDLKFDKGTGKIVEMDRMRQMIADHMVYSKHTSPHVTAYVEADLTEMVKWRNAHKEAFQKKHKEKLTFTPLFIECVAKAIKDFPMINSSLDGRNIIVKEDINIGMAAALPSGNLIVPVVKNADKKNLIQLASEINSLSAKARNNKLKLEDTQGSTFTISNVGTFGSVMGTPIINQPEAAILATGIIKKRAEVLEKPEGDVIEIRSMMYLSLSFDHRIVDGNLAGSFLKRIADYMEQFDLKRTY
jgi:2-oxoglutarate dehydrogenase E2 component (dihydrolipoamide succinyltransferase)